MTKRIREGGEKGPDQKIGRICYIGLLTRDLWKEVAQWLLAEESGGSALLPLICKKWNDLYKSCENWRLIEFLKDRRGSDVIKAAFCRRLCNEGYFMTVVINDKPTDSWLIHHDYDFVGYEVSESLVDWVPKDFFGRDLVFYLEEDIFRPGSGGRETFDVYVELLQPTGDSFLKKLVNWNGSRGKLVADFVGVILGDGAIAKEFILFMGPAKPGFKCF